MQAGNGFAAIIQFRIHTLRQAVDRGPSMLLERHLHPSMSMQELHGRLSRDSVYNFVSQQCTIAVNILYILYTS